MVRGSAGGQALKAKVHPQYFRFIGRRGGRRSKRNELLSFAEDLVRQGEADRATIWVERAQEYHDECGTKIFLELWLPAELEDEKLKRRRRRRRK